MSNKNFKLYGKVMDPTKFLKYIKESESFPLIYGKYEVNSAYPKDKNFTYWESYKGTDSDSEIRFLRNKDLNPLMNEMSDEAVKIYDSIFKGKIKADREKIILLRTCGIIGMHTDNRRESSFNIGLLNSLTAKVRVTNDFSKDLDVFQIDDGEACLLNTQSKHKVEGLEAFPRYLLSYDFDTEKFKELKEII
jgi:hypothetical protein